MGLCLLCLSVGWEVTPALSPIPSCLWTVSLPPAEVGLMRFHEPGIYNYSALLMSEDQDTLYVGAREAVFALRALDVSRKLREVRPVPPEPVCGRRPLPQRLLFLSLLELFLGVLGVGCRGALCPQPWPWQHSPGWLSGPLSWTQAGPSFPKAQLSFCLVLQGPLCFLMLPDT